MSKKRFHGGLHRFPDKWGKDPESMRTDGEGPPGGPSQIVPAYSDEAEIPSAKSRGVPGGP